MAMGPHSIGIGPFSVPKGESTTAVPFVICWSIAIQHQWGMGPPFVLWSSHGCHVGSCTDDQALHFGWAMTSAFQLFPWLPSEGRIIKNRTSSFHISVMICNSVQAKAGPKLIKARPIYVMIIGPTLKTEIPRNKRQTASTVKIQTSLYWCEIKGG